MNRLKSQAGKRLRRGARQAARATSSPAGQVTAVRWLNRAARQYAKKRGLLAEGVASTLADAIAAVPDKWEGSMQVRLEPGTYGFPKGDE